MRFTPIVLAIAVSGIAALSVAQTAQKLTFEVASIKPSRNGQQSIDGSPGGYFSATGLTLKILMTFAYGVEADHIRGGPAWVENDAWDIQAKADPDSMQARQTTNRGKLTPTALMLQALLEDRFQLKVHSEGQELAVYVLTTGKGALKLTPSSDQTSPDATNQNLPIEQRRYIIRRTADVTKGQGVPIAMLVSILSSEVGRPVVDKTGLKGLFDFTLHWTQSPIPAGVNTAGPEIRPSTDTASIFTAIEEIGLKLESGKDRQDILVIDSVSRPSEN